MKKAAPDYNTIDEYISMFAEPVRKILNELRYTIREAAPGAEETINYRIPTYSLNGNLVHFAAFKNHVGFYPEPSAVEAFSKDLAGYETTKGSIRFPLDKPVPFDLVKRIVRFRVNENLSRKNKNMTGSRQEEQ